jgi:Mg-chelatase subunit ChlD
MPTRQRIVTYGISATAIGAILLAAALTPWHRRGSPRSGGQPRSIDVVFAVDTTGSMGGLIEGAKRTVWSIANHIRSTDPNAELRLGLVAYRDIGDEYVTRELALTSDLDAVFAELSALQAQGGGDTPENVDAALHAALTKMQWRPEAKRVVFLVGDAEPASRGDVPTFETLARQAADRQIVINTIRCGHDVRTEAAFEQIASLARGSYSSIAQDGGVQQVATPYDEKLAELSARIDRDAVIIGGAVERARHASAVMAIEAAPASAAADRAGYYAMSPGKARGKGDAVRAYEAGELDLEKVNETDLPEELRGLDKRALEAQLARRAAERNAREQEIGKLAKQRAEFLKNHADKGGTGFDAKVKESLDRQLKD